MAMDRQATTAVRSLKRKLEPEKSDNHNEARKFLVVEDPNRDGIALPKHRWSHDVFLSFRGEDTRKNFVDHLFKALELAGIHTFRDGNDLRRGMDISTQLFNALRESRIFIVVFSKGYASSSWCLDELVEILRCSRNTIGHIVFPIFYHVDPSDVRYHTGTFAEAFIRHENRFKPDMERVWRWKAALTQAANFTGLDINHTNGYEARFIQMIVEEVRKISSRWSLECFCGRTTYLRTSWTVDNPGRRFFGCARYGQRSPCRFFKWFDPPICARSAKLIPSMRKKIKRLEEQLRKQAPK